jgi:hypothetical protein
MRLIVLLSLFLAAGFAAVDVMGNVGQPGGQPAAPASGPAFTDVNWETWTPMPTGIIGDANRLKDSVKPQAAKRRNGGRTKQLPESGRPAPCGRLGASAGRDMESARGWRGSNPSILTHKGDTHDR